MCGLGGMFNPGVGTSVETGEIANGAVTEAKLGFTDVATANASAAAHGLLPKLSNSATEFLNGVGAFATPTAGIGGSTGATDNALLGADGTGGATLQARAAKISDSGVFTLTGAGAVVEIGDGTGNKLSYTNGSGPRFINADDVALVFVISGLSASRNVTVQDAAGTMALTANKLSDFAATTSAELAGVISDETGSGGGFVRATAPTITTPTISGARCLGFTTTAAAPTTTEYPNDKDFGFHKNSTTGVVTVTFNDGGAIKVIALA